MVSDVLFSVTVTMKKDFDKWSYHPYQRVLSRRRYVHVVYYVSDTVQKDVWTSDTSSFCVSHPFIHPLSVIKRGRCGLLNYVTRSLTFLKIKLIFSTRFESERIHFVSMRIRLMARKLFYVIVAAFRCTTFSLICSSFLILFFFLASAINDIAQNTIGIRFEIIFFVNRGIWRIFKK